MYQLFVGEIGTSRKEYLYDLDYWEILLISRGYQNRARNLWSAMRWHAYNVMSAIPYCDLKKGGIRKPQDLITFPWEEHKASLPTEDEKEDVLRDIQAFRKKKGGQ